MYEYKCLNNATYREIANCFNLAFSDYDLPIQLTEEQIQTRFEMSGVDLGVSYGAYWENSMVGFIFNSFSIFNSHRVVFDVGTGVIPKHRGKRVFTKLFQYTEKELQKQNIEQYYLEVLQQNEKAISSYRNQGFAVSREFTVLKASHCAGEISGEGLYDRELDEFDFSGVSHLNHLRPSYEHSTVILNRNADQYKTAYLLTNGCPSAFCIYEKESGAIVQMGYSVLKELERIIRHLLSKYDKIIVKNIDLTYVDLIEMFHSIGFQEVARQYEMVKAYSIS